MMAHKYFKKLAVAAAVLSGAAAGHIIFRQKVSQEGANVGLSGHLKELDGKVSSGLKTFFSEF